MIPTYELYGEDEPASARFWVHCETIPARSSQYHWEIGLHRHDHFFQILLVTGGSGDALFGNDIVRFEPCAVLTVPPGIHHGFRFSPDIDGHVLTFLASRLPARPGEPNQLGAFLSSARVTQLDDRQADSGLIRESILRLCDEWQERRSGRAIMMEACLATALTLAARLAGQDAGDAETTDENDRRMEVLNAMMHREVKNHRAASFYAKALGISPTHLNRVVKDKAGVSTQELLMRRLLEEAQRELLFAPGSIQEVAFRLGFADPAYFSRFFTRQTGSTPRAWRLREQQRLSPRDNGEAVTGSS
ncbi:helix-turn-helix domain-containing protein [Rhizobium sp. 18065]|uniref:helix-turn-helix domain-containing protein n=1 Tax=Rhizobium sp. 18065 TaxID=2681411 RepID=UPI001FCE4725|nr:helix-turn-helix domain-containing protein [Rhizobium sp. 18065]